MDKLEQAKNGTTHFFTYDELFLSGLGFLSEADLTVWCTTFGLSFTYSSTTELYKIFKP